METTRQEYQNMLKHVLISAGLAPVEVKEHNYWFLRTQGGEYFEEFYVNDFVAIGWDDVPSKSEADRTDDLKNKMKEKYGQPTRVLNQVYKFCEQMKAGDIVIIPSTGSALLAFGRITDNNIYEYISTEEDIEANKCPYKRRRKVEWLKTSKRNLIDPKLFTFFRNQQALATVNDYAEFIERAINPFYIKDNIAHLNLSVKIDKSPKATDIPYYMLGITERMKFISDKLEIDVEEPESRINVQSHGTIEFLGEPCSIFLVALSILALFGGSFNIWGIKLETPGLPSALSKLADAYEKYRLAKLMVPKEKIAEIQERLHIENPIDK